MTDPAPYLSSRLKLDWYRDRTDRELAFLRFERDVLREELAKMRAEQPVMAKAAGAA